jgi:hypothetical protein
MIRNDKMMRQFERIHNYVDGQNNYVVTDVRYKVVELNGKLGVIFGTLCDNGEVWFNDDEQFIEASNVPNYTWNRLIKDGGLHCVTWN